MSVKQLLAGAAIAALAAVVVNAQTPRLPASPEGRAQAQVGGKWLPGQEASYQGGKWIEITYGRPGLKGRTNIFGSGADYGKDVSAGAPDRRAGTHVLAVVGSGPEDVRAALQPGPAVGDLDPLAALIRGFLARQPLAADLRLCPALRTCRQPGRLGVDHDRRERGDGCARKQLLH